jgi:hypothetical protein
VCKHPHTRGLVRFNAPKPAGRCYNTPACVWEKDRISPSRCDEQFVRGTGMDLGGGAAVLEFSESAVECTVGAGSGTFGIGSGAKPGGTMGVSTLGGGSTE